MNRLVVDVSHHQNITDLKAAFDWGIRGVIHKASQGAGYKDPKYDTVRQMAKEAGLLWGAYHFGTGANVSAQVDNFIRSAAPDASILVALDYEDNADQMSLEQAKEFLRLLEARLGRKAVLYSGNTIKQTMSVPDGYINSHQLWIAQYGPRVDLPPGWSSYFLWQITGDGVGPAPHDVPGIGTNLDLNVFDGTVEVLTAQWANVPSVPSARKDAPMTNGAPEKIDHIPQIDFAAVEQFVESGAYVIPLALSGPWAMIIPAPVKTGLTAVMAYLPLIEGFLKLADQLDHAPIEQAPPIIAAMLRQVADKLEGK